MQPLVLAPIMTSSTTLAVALVSGGLDLMVAAARAREDGHRLLALSDRL